MVLNQFWKDLKRTQRPASVLHVGIINERLDNIEEGNVRWEIKIAQDT